MEIIDKIIVKNKKYYQKHLKYNSMKTQFYFLYILFLVFACAEKNDSKVELPENSYDLEAEYSKIEQLRSEFQQTIKEKRYGDLGRFTTADFKGFAPASEDWLEYQKFRQDPMSMFSYDSIIMHPQETVIVSDSVAYDFGTSNVYYTKPDGTLVELEDTFLVILKKDLEGNWKIHREVASGTVE